MRALNISKLDVWRLISEKGPKGWSKIIGSAPSHNDDIDDQKPSIDFSNEA